MKLDVKGIIAILVILGVFAIIGVYVYRGQAPDAVVASLASGALMAVISFYFGHVNGAATALANQAAQLASQAITASTQRRAGDPPTVQAPVTVVAPPQSTGGAVSTAGVPPGGTATVGG